MLLTHAFRTKMRVQRTLFNFTSCKVKRITSLRVLWLIDILYSTWSRNSMDIHLKFQIINPLYGTDAHIDSMNFMSIAYSFITSSLCRIRVWRTVEKRVLCILPDFIYYCIKKNNLNTRVINWLIPWSACKIVISITVAIIAIAWHTVSRRV